MPNKPDSFLRPIIDTIDREHALWVSLHRKLCGVLDNPSEMLDDDDYVDVPLRDKWYVHIMPYQDDSRTEPHHNRWGQELSCPIEIGLWLLESGPEFSSGEDISDNPKLTIVCSSQGIINAQTGEHLSEAEVEGLAADLQDIESYEHGKPAF